MHTAVGGPLHGLLAVPHQIEILLSLLPLSARHTEVLQRILVFCRSGLHLLFNRFQTLVLVCLDQKLGPSPPSFLCPSLHSLASQWNSYRSSLPAELRIPDLHRARPRSLVHLVRIDLDQGLVHNPVSPRHRTVRSSWSLWRKPAGPSFHQVPVAPRTLAAYSQDLAPSARDLA